MLGAECEPSDYEVIRWGILGCANIAKKNIRAIKLSQRAQLVAIASRDISKAMAFASDNKCAESIQIYGDYESLLADKSVNAVYIPLPTTLHVQWVVKAAEAKKHILLEKPVAVCESDYLIMLEACEANCVMLLDGVMFMHHQRLASLGKFLQDPFLGVVTRVNSSFSFNGNSPAFLEGNIRTSSKGHESYLFYLIVVNKSNSSYRPPHTHTHTTTHPLPLSLC